MHGYYFFACTLTTQIIRRTRTIGVSSAVLFVLGNLCPGAETVNLQGLCCSFHGSLQSHRSAQTGCFRGQGPLLCETRLFQCPCRPSMSSVTPGPAPLSLQSASCGHSSPTSKPHQQPSLAFPPEARRLSQWQVPLAPQIWEQQRFPCSTVCTYTQLRGCTRCPSLPMLMTGKRPPAPRTPARLPSSLCPHSQPSRVCILSALSSVTLQVGHK